MHVAYGLKTKTVIIVRKAVISHLEVLNFSPLRSLKFFLKPFSFIKLLLPVVLIKEHATLIVLNLFPAVSFSNLVCLQSRFFLANALKTNSFSFAKTYI